MKWSKLKKLVEARTCASLSKRVAIYSTAYGNCTCGHAWLTLDKEIIANFCTRAFWNRCPKHRSSSTGQWEHEGPLSFELPAPQQNVYAAQSAEYGELSRQGAYYACWEFVHSLSIEDALASEDILVQSLAVIDARVGKRRLNKIQSNQLCPLGLRLYSARIEAEK